MASLEELYMLVDSVHQAYGDGDQERIFERSADIMSLYLDALNDIHFDGARTDWLNDLVAAIDGGEGSRMVELINQAAAAEERFLGSQIAALFSGFRQDDSLMTLAQAAGIRALLEEM